MSVYTPIKRYKLIEIVALIFFTVITIYAVKQEAITIFYLIYLFWNHEFLKTLFDAIYLKRYKNLKPELKNIKTTIPARFFLLSIYFVFIIVCFGFMIDWDNRDTILKNIEIITFRNSIFNITLFGFILYEMARLHFNKEQNIFISRQVFSKGLLTLHLSIVFVVFVWAIISGRLFNISFNLMEYNAVLAIVPFLIIKLIFEILEIKDHSNQVRAN